MKNITYNIPGGWYGNDPGKFGDPKIGVVCIDAKKTVAAITWLRKRASIRSTRISDTINPGLVISYRLR